MRERGMIGFSSPDTWWFVALPGPKYVGYLTVPWLSKEQGEDF